MFFENQVFISSIQNNLECYLYFNDIQAYTSIMH